MNASVRLLPGSRCAYPGYESTAVCGPVARVRRLRRNPGMRRDKYIGAASSRVALRLPGLRVHRRLWASSPGQAFTPQPGMYGDKYIDAASSRVALRLPGLRVHRRLRAGSQDRRSAPPPGMRRDKYIGAASSRVALRLPGPGVHRRLRAGSPDRRSAPPPGKPGSINFRSPSPGAESGAARVAAPPAPRPQ